MLGVGRCDSCGAQAHRLHIMESADRVCDECAEILRDEWGMGAEFTGETED